MECALRITLAHAMKALREEDAPYQVISCQLQLKSPFLSNLLLYISVMEECEVNMCGNNATCVKHVSSYTCECPSGFIGGLCEEEGESLSYYSGRRFTALIPPFFRTTLPDSSD